MSLNPKYYDLLRKLEANPRAEMNVEDVPNNSMLVSFIKSRDERDEQSRREREEIKQKIAGKMRKIQMIDIL